MRYYISYFFDKYFIPVYFLYIAWVVMILIRRKHPIFYKLEKQNKMLTLTPEQLAEMIAKARLEGRKEELEFWKDHFCPCEISHPTRGAFQAHKIEIRNKLKELEHVHI